ncbi:MAG: asparagine synthase (glutamine-hydrolyzing) [Eubacteriales bacterium]
MCGYALIYKKQSFTPEDGQALLNMSQAIRHRGPDENKIVHLDKIGLAFRRLSIIDLEGGSQPFTYMERYTAIYNGELYNYLELRAPLIDKGYVFRTNSEIEVMLTMYHDEGPDFIKKLRGMFSFIIYDAEKNTLMAGRDPFGIKPFYYKQNDVGLVASSEMKAFIFDQSIEGFGVDTSLLQHYMTYQYVPEPNTITGQVKILRAGHYFVCEGAGDVVPVKYVEPRLVPNKTPYEEKLKRVREAVESSVRYHMISDVPVGTFLSSGIDSAIITAVASRLTPGIKAFTVAFNEKEYSEIDDAAQIAAHLDVEHITVNGTPKDFMDAYEDVIFHLDSPTADPSTVAIYIICREAARHVKVVLSGEGSDELFGGYKVYRDGLATQKIAAFPGFLKSMLRALANVLPEGMKGKQLLVRGTTPLEHRFVGNAFIFNEEQKKDILKIYNPSQRFYDLSKEVYGRNANLSYPARMQECDLEMWLKGDILVKGDRLSMGHALEVRVPFIDREVFAVASTLNDKDKFSGRTTKYILRHAFRDLVNEETFVRPKLGYPVPVRKWLKNELYDWARDIISTSGADAYINKDAAYKMLEDHRSGRADNYRTLWVVLVFMTWHRLYVEQIEDTKKRILGGEL